MTTTTTRATQLDWVGLLARVLGDTPALRGAACRGRSELFDQSEAREDPDELAYRHRVAQALCAGCPARTACAEWAGGDLENTPSGIVAGELHTWRHWRPRDPEL